MTKEIFNNFNATVNADGTVIASYLHERAFKRSEQHGRSSFTEEPNHQARTEMAKSFCFVLGRQYKQVTVSRDADATENFVVKGFNDFPALSGNGQVLAFVSGFNYAGTTTPNNADFNAEIFTYRTQDPANTFRQLTATTGTAAVPAGGPLNLMVRFSRPLDFSGNNLVFESAADLSGTNADKTREIFLANLAGGTPVFRQITNQATGGTPPGAILVLFRASMVRHIYHLRQH